MSVTQNINELLVIQRKLEQPGFLSKYWRKELDPQTRTQLEARQRELSIAVWNEMKAIKYFKRSIRAVNDVAELNAEQARLVLDLQFAWEAHYGVILDKENLYSYNRYIMVKLDDLRLEDMAEKYQDGRMNVNMLEIVEFYMAERGIDLRDRYGILSPMTPEDQHKLDQFYSKGGRLRVKRR